MAFSWNPSAPATGAKIYQTQVTGITAAAENNIAVFCSAKDSSYYSSQRVTNYGTYNSGKQATHRGYDGHNGSARANYDSYNSKRTNHASMY